MNIIDTRKYKDDFIVLRDSEDLLDINSDVLGESSSQSSSLVFNG
jgi:hypothetical protein